MGRELQSNPAGITIAKCLLRSAKRKLKGDKKTKEIDKAIKVVWPKGLIERDSSRTTLLSGKPLISQRSIEQVNSNSSLQVGWLV